MVPSTSLDSDSLGMLPRNPLASQIKGDSRDFLLPGSPSSRKVSPAVPLGEASPARKGSNGGAAAPVSSGLAPDLRSALEAHPLGMSSSPHLPRPDSTGRVSRSDRRGGGGATRSSTAESPRSSQVLPGSSHDSNSVGGSTPTGAESPSMESPRSTNPPAKPLAGGKSPDNSPRTVIPLHVADTTASPGSPSSLRRSETPPSIQRSEGSRSLSSPRPSTPIAPAVGGSGPLLEAIVELDETQQSKDPKKKKGENTSMPTMPLPVLTGVSSPNRGSPRTIRKQSFLRTSSADAKTNVFGGVDASEKGLAVSAPAGPSKTENRMSGRRAPLTIDNLELLEADLPPDALAALLREHGNAAIKKKNIVDSFVFYNRACIVEPENPLNFINRAVAQMKCSNYTIALVDLDAALELDPRSAVALARKGQTLFAMNRKDEAFECVEKARAIDPKLPELKKIKKTDLLAVAVRGHVGVSRNSSRSDVTQQSAPSPVVSHKKDHGIFGRSLDDLMNAQQRAHSAHLVPEIVPFLTQRLVECGGLTSEGIFRLSIASNELQVHLNTLSKGVCELGSKDPNVYAVLLKHFFRNLPEPLCPDFAACLKIVEDYATHDTSASLRRRKGTSPLLEAFSESTSALLEELWKGMSENRRSLSVYLFKLFSLLLQPEHERCTKMSLENLAVVFIGGILRDPDPSPMSALVSQPNCQQFVCLFYQYVQIAQFPNSPIQLPRLLKQGNSGDLSHHVTLRNSADSSQDGGLV